MNSERVHLRRIIQLLVDDSITKSERFFTSEDLNRELPEGKVIKVTIEYVNEEETNG